MEVIIAFNPNVLGEDEVEAIRETIGNYKDKGKILVGTTITLASADAVDSVAWIKRTGEGSCEVLRASVRNASDLEGLSTAALAANIGANVDIVLLRTSSGDIPRGVQRGLDELLRSSGATTIRATDIVGGKDRLAELVPKITKAIAKPEGSGNPYTPKTVKISQGSSRCGLLKLWEAQWEELSKQAKCKRFLQELPAAERRARVLAIARTGLDGFDKLCTNNQMLIEMLLPSDSE